MVYKVPTLRVPGNATYSFSVPAFKNFGSKATLEEFQPDVAYYLNKVPLSVNEPLQPMDLGYTFEI